MSEPKYVHSFSLNFQFKSDLLGEDPEQEEVVLKEVAEYLKTLLTSEQELPGYLEWWGTEDNPDYVEEK